MAYQARLNFESKEFDVVRCECCIERSLDAKGRPSSDLYGGRITVEIESTADTTIFTHMATQFTSNSGTITFKKDEVDVMKEMAWKNGYIIDLIEGMSNTEGTPMSLVFTVSAQTLTVGGIDLKQNWPEVS